MPLCSGPVCGDWREAAGRMLQRSSPPAKRGYLYCTLPVESLGSEASFGGLICTSPPLQIDYQVAGSSIRIFNTDAPGLENDVSVFSLQRDCFAQARSSPGFCFVATCLSIFRGKNRSGKTFCRVYTSGPMLPSCDVTDTKK